MHNKKIHIVQTVLITTLGCEKNRNTDVCQRFLTLDDLFA